MWMSFGAFVASAVSLYVSAAAMSTARRSLILTLLMIKGEMSGLQLKEHGVGGLVYNSLHRLETEGLVESRAEPDEFGARGGLPRRFYKLKGTGVPS